MLSSFTSYNLFGIWTTGSLDVRANGRWKESELAYQKLRKALCIGYANQLAERMIHHNGYRTLSFKPQLVQVIKSGVYSLLVATLYLS